MSSYIYHIPKNIFDAGETMKLKYTCCANSTVQ